MQALQARIESFSKTKRIKRYPKKTSSATASVKWPHSSDFKANANTLAEAGFFFNPSWDDRDTVTCFTCGKELSDWDADDDPFEIHYTKCRNACAWAVVRCGLAEDLDDEGNFTFVNKTRLPSSKAMEKARLGTFREDWWRHDEERDHGATSVRMAQAGFVYTPQFAGDDTVTCLYCNLSLGGWEKDDDPIQEHRSRVSKSGTACPFFALPDPPPPRAKRGKARSLVSVAPSETRRRARTTRGKSVKPSRPPSPFNDPSPPQNSVGSPVRTDCPPDPTSKSPPISLSPTGQPAVLYSHDLTPEEREMSLEQWIRQEISLSYERLANDGQRQIQLFKEKAVEIRKCIDEL